MDYKNFQRSIHLILHKEHESELILFLEEIIARICLNIKCDFKNFLHKPTCNLFYWIKYTCHKLEQLHCNHKYHSDMVYVHLEFQSIPIYPR